MADCSVADVLTKAMSILGDPDGEITQEIVDDFGTSYLDHINLLNKISAPEITRDMYFTVPANTGAISVATLGMDDFSQPQQLWERGNVATAAITGTTDGTPITVTFPGAVPPGPQIELQGIQGVPSWVNRDWYITVTGAHTCTLNGSVLCGANGSGGTAQWSNEPFAKMQPSDSVPFAGPQLNQSVFGSWRWQDNWLYVPACSQPRQLWIQYTANSVPPASGVIGLCEGRELNSLAYSTGAYFAPKRGIAQGPQLAARAWGESGIPDGSGGLIRELITPILLQDQTVQRVSGLFRSRRFPVVTY